MKRILCFACSLCALMTTPKVAYGWIQFLDGSTLPGPPEWQMFVDGQTDTTTVMTFADPIAEGATNALRITTFGATADEFFVGPLSSNEMMAGARFRLVEFTATGKMNLLDVVTRSTLLSPTPSITLVDGRYKLWNYVLADTEIMDIGPAVSNQWHTAYLWARNDGKVKLWWDGKLTFDGDAPLVNPYDGYFEWGCGSWEYSAAATADFDWVGWGDATDLPLALITNPANGTSYNTNSAFSFTATSATGIASNGFAITLNGVNRASDLIITGSDTNRQGTLGPLFPNRFYHVLLTITDLATNISTYTIDFDTIKQNNFTFEAEDWNFDSGQFLDNVVLSSIPASDNYLDRNGVDEIDQHELSLDPTASQHQYRQTSLVGTEHASDVLRQKYIDAEALDSAVSDYDVGWTEQGEWLNYTRTFPSGQYYVYGRLASGNGVPFEATLAKVTGATTSSQLTNELGSFKGDIGHGWQFYSFIPLTDAGSNQAVVTLSGVQTLRVTAASTNGFNANFYMLIPAPILHLALQNGKAIVSWQTNLDGFALQNATSLSAPDWATLSNRVFVVNGRNTVTNDLLGTSRFFRLRQ